MAEVLLDGEPVGAATCALMPGMEEDAAAFAVNCVLPEARRQGVGTAIYRQVSVHARSLGKSELAVFGFEDDVDGVAFAERRGFVVVSRIRGLRLLHHATIASSNSALSSSAPAGRGESFVTRCCGSVPSTSAGMSADV